MRPILGFSEETYHNFPAKCVYFLAKALGSASPAPAVSERWSPKFRRATSLRLSREKSLKSVLGWRPPQKSDDFGSCLAYVFVCFLVMVRLRFHSEFLFGYVWVYCLRLF